MKISNFIFSVVLLTAIGATAEEKTKTHSSNTDANNTEVTTDTSTTESVNRRGTKYMTSDEKTVVDPTGLNNKETAARHYEKKQDPSGDYSENTKIEHADGTTEKLSGSQETRKHWTNSGSTTTTTSAHEVDPKGLLNKRKTEVTEKSVTNPGQNTKRTITKKVDGDTVSESTVTVN